MTGQVCPWTAAVNTRTDTGDKIVENKTHAHTHAHTLSGPSEMGKTNRMGGLHYRQYPDCDTRHGFANYYLGKRGKGVRKLALH